MKNMMTIYMWLEVRAVEVEEVLLGVMEDMSGGVLAGCWT